MRNRVFTTKNKLAVDIGSQHIKVLYGTDKKIKKFGLLETPDGCIDDNRILNVEKIDQVINEFLLAEKIDTKKISYVIHGQDIIVRDLDIPKMDAKNIEEAVRWEINRNLPESGKNYYLDYQILKIEEAGKKKGMKVLAVAVPIERINAYMELTQMLGLDIDAIDISGNSVARVFNPPGKAKKTDYGIGVIFIGSKGTGISIIESGNLIVEREVPFGTDNLIREIVKRNQVEAAEAYRYLINDFSFENSEEEGKTNERLKSLLDNVFSSFQKVIQFYGAGRERKLLDEVFVTGSGSGLKGLELYLAKSLGSPVTIIDGTSMIKKKIELPVGCDAKYFLSAYGMLLRRDQ